MGGEEEKQEGHQKGFKVHHTGATCPGTVCAAYGIYTSQLMEPTSCHSYCPEGARSLSQIQPLPLIHCSCQGYFPISSPKLAKLSQITSH